MFTKRNIDVKLKISCNETARSIYHSVCLILSYDNKNGSYSYVTNYIMTRHKLYFSLIPQNTALFIHAGNRYWQRKLWKKNLKYWRCCKYNNIMHSRYWLVKRQYVPLRSIISYFIWKAELPVTGTSQFLIYNIYIYEFETATGEIKDKNGYVRKF